MRVKALNTSLSLRSEREIGIESCERDTTERS